MGDMRDDTHEDVPYEFVGLSRRWTYRPDRPAQVIAARLVEIVLFGAAAATAAAFMVGASQLAFLVVDWLFPI